MPLDDETKAVIAGRGDIAASFDGKVLTVKGDFHGLPSNATEAHIFQSAWTGVPGKQILDLEVTKSTTGTLSGALTLTGAQAAAPAHRQALYPDQQRKGPAGLQLGAERHAVGLAVPRPPDRGPGRAAAGPLVRPPTRHPVALTLEGMEHA